MGNKKGNLSTVFLVIAIILIIVMGALLYMQKTEADRQIAELKNNASELKETINNLQEKIDNASNVINPNDSENTSNTNENSFMIVSVENENANELASKYKLITDKKETDNLINIINRATKYEAKTFFTLESCPSVKLYDANGKKYTIVAIDQLDDEGNIVNLITKWEKEDQSDKELYKVDVKLAEHIKNLYNTVEASTSTSDSDKEIYIFTGDVNIENIKYIPDFIVMENNEIYLSTNLSNKILEGTYTVNSNNTIEYNVLKEIQDYEFYTSSTLQFENIHGEKNIVIVDNEQNGKMYYQKIH